MIAAGGMKKIATIQKPVISKAANGEDIKTWTTVCKRFVMVATRGGTENEPSNLRVQSVTLYEIQLRYESLLRAMTPTWRIVINGQQFDITSVENVGLQNRKFKLTARAYAT